MEEKDDQIYFCTHCEEDGCDLGHAEYSCPRCNSLNEDFGDLWWGHNTVGLTRIIVDSCGNCSVGLVAKYKEKIGWVIRTTE